MIKNSPANAGDAGDAGLIPGSGRSPGGRNDNPLQYSCLGNRMVRGDWWGHRESATTEHACTQDKIFKKHCKY